MNYAASPAAFDLDAPSPPSEATIVTNVSSHCDRERGLLLAICVSPGGIPKLPQPDAWLTVNGFVGDGRNHTKHIRPDRAVSLLDMEVIEQLQCEGFTVAPGAIGENLTVLGLNVQRLSPGTLLQLGQILLRLEEPRKPCYVLDSIDPRLKDVIVGRCGYMASVVRGGLLVPGSRVVPIVA
ncbi:MAG: MOSC domain-containing protein [Planctomycetia bacterium]|nr:MOSC domain-containing protein [Planctomycetia bacterium]